MPTEPSTKRCYAFVDGLSNILKTFNDQFGNISWTDADRVHKLIPEDIPARGGGGFGLPEHPAEL